MVGDELRLKLDSLSARLWGNKAWEGSGHVLRIADGEVALEMRSNNVPSDLVEVRRQSWREGGLDGHTRASVRDWHVKA